MENAGEVHENCKILRRTIKTNNEETLLESDARRSQIAEAVLYIMENYGADAVTVRRVAKLVGVTGAALYRYYKSKTDVLMAVLEQQYGMLVENSHKALKEAQGSLDFLKIFYRYNMDIVVRYRMLPIFFLLDSIMLDEDRLQKLNATCKQSLQELIVCFISKAQRAGEIRQDISPNEVFMQYLGLIAMPFLMRFNSPPDTELTNLIDVNWKLFIWTVAS